MDTEVLVYTCCDKKYEIFIPLFCYSIAHFNRNVSIEIGIESEFLPDEVISILTNIELRYKCPIHIEYSAFKVLSDGFALYNGIRMKKNSVRFVREPKLKSKYVYISDIDIINLTEDFYKIMLSDMSSRNSCYSNIVRNPNAEENKIHMSGLHFIETSKYFPIGSYNGDFSICDEILLYNIMKSKHIEIDYTTKFRPVHGIHISMNRDILPTVVNGKQIPGFGVEMFDKTKYVDFRNTEIYNDILKIGNEYINLCTKKLDSYYEI